ncbi:NAD(P)/FAD-dependent oxidoreductase [Microbacterium gorillae]|uniref:NAD(P)/FAD-dependent oxidoreductase n=1 Tax=Microbacterium gorillae TaxID=1231063 RepID=UPI000AA86D12|nr:FAD/NAD(P)-binding oxidoreductase [Microbacterium gorillae]
MDQMKNIAIVGASLAGLRGAEELRRQGYDGELTLIDASEHHPAIDRPPLSKEVLSGKWTPEEARLEIFEDVRARLILGVAATGLDLEAGVISLADGQEITFDGLMIATGAGVRHLRCPGSDLPGVMYYRDLDDCLTLRDHIERGSRVAIVGGGFIGSEVAASLALAGLEVTIIDTVPLPMEAQIGPIMANHLADQHRAHGVTLKLGAGVEAIEGETAVTGVRLTGGEVIPADVVVTGIGVIPNTAWLAESGLEIDNGVVCDEHCRAIGAENVVVAGDIARFQHRGYDRAMRIEHWTNAVDQGEYAARALLGTTADGYAPLPFFWSDQYDMHVQFAGVKGQEEEIVKGSVEEGRFLIEMRTDGNLTGILGVNQNAAFGRARRALAAELAAAVPVTG